MPETIRAFTRMDQVQAPIIPIIGRMIRQTPGTISLGQGVVHYGPPPQVADAVRAALSRVSTHEYNDGAGIPALVQRIAKKLAAENQIDVSRGSRIMVTAGANMAFMHAVMATTAPGDEVILPTPFYFNHEMAIDMAGCRAVRVPTDDNYQLRVDAIANAVTSRTRALPSRSTGDGWTAGDTPAARAHAGRVRSGVRRSRAVQPQPGVSHLGRAGPRDGRLPVTHPR